MTALDDQTEIWGQGTTVSGTRSLLVLVGARHVVRQLSRALLDFTLVVGIGVVLVIFGHRLHLIDGVHDTNERTPWHPVQRVTAGTNLTVDLETTTKPAGTYIRH